MAKRWTLLAAAMVAFCFFSCEAIEGVVSTTPLQHAGKYYSMEDLRYFTVLQTNGQFFVHQAEGDLKGHYSVDKDRLRLTLAGGEVSLLGRIRADTLIDNDGKEWIRPQVCFTNRTIRQESFLDLQDRLPKGWLLRLWEGRYYICKRPEGPPPSSLDGEAAVILVRHGDSDALATARNMVADTPEFSMHLCYAPSGALWPKAKEDLIAVFLVETNPRTGGATSGSQPSRSGKNQTPSTAASGQ